MGKNLAYLTFLINEKYKGRNTLEQFKRLQDIQFCSKKELQERQFEKLKNLLIHAYRNVEYYKESFDRAGFCPEFMNCPEDFRKAPVLEKKDIRSRPGKFLAKDKNRKFNRMATSGSSGDPLIFYLDRDREASDKAAHLFSRHCWGIGVGDREAVLWSGYQEFSRLSFIKKIRDHFLNSHLLPAFHMNRQLMEKYISFLRRYRPRHIFGYANAVYLLAAYAKENKLNLAGLGIKVVFVTAEALYDFQRSVIEEVFQAPVADTYGGRDSGLIAFECPKKSMHLNPNIYTEIIPGYNKQEGAGQKGDIIITHLDSYGMPFIRYRTGDEAELSVAEGCLCGRNFGIIKHILGRNTDYIIGKNGEFIHSLAIMYIFREIKGIDYFKVVQEKKDDFTIYIVKNSAYAIESESLIKEKMQKLLSLVLKISFNYVEIDALPRQDKYKFIESKLIKEYIS